VYSQSTESLTGQGLLVYISNKNAIAQAQDNGLKNCSNANAEVVSVESVNEAIFIRQVSGSVELV